MKNLVYIVLFMILYPKMDAQHNSDYVQYMFNGLLLNPAYAGSHDALNITALGRKQWLGLPGAPSTAALSLHSPLKNRKLNLGAVVLNEQFGVFSHTKVSVIYAYRFKFLTGKLSFGLQAGVDSYSTNWNKINTTESEDPNFFASQTRAIIPEAGIGTYYHTKVFYLGFSIPNLFNSTLNPGKVSMLSTGAILTLNDYIKFKPAVFVKYIRHSPVSANISTTFYYKDIVGVGVGYTYKTSALAYLDIRLNDQLRCGYGFDYTLSALQKYTSGSHEIMLRYLFKYQIKGSNPRYF